MWHVNARRSETTSVWPNIAFDGTKSKLKLNHERHGKADDKDTYGRVGSKKLKKLSDYI